MRLSALVLLLAVVISSFTACTLVDEVKKLLGIDTGIGDNGGNTEVSGDLTVHFIDIGQGDAILIRQGTQSMLIDTGDTDSSNRKKLLAYIENLGITTIDWLILTHPDADHIGGAADVINKFSVMRCIMPDAEKSTATFTRLMDALEKSSDTEVIQAVSGYSFKLGTAECLLLAPISEKYSDTNNYSAVLRLTYGAKRMIFSGDAERESEEEILKKYPASDLKCDLLKLGHHGSSTSSTDEYLDAISPSYAVISCGVGNKYGHPHKETMTKLSKRGITVYRTDTMGTVILTTDGTTMRFQTEK